MTYQRYEKIKVLVVDDFKQFHNTISGMLEDFGVALVDTAVNDVQAINACRSKKYDLVLCDYNMGQNKKNGQQILESLQQNRLLPINCLFVLVTAEVSKAMVMATYDCEPDGYIVKPFNAKLLKQRLDRLLQRRDAMLDINIAIAEGDEEKAIGLCENELRNDGRYRSDCLKLLGKLYLSQQMLERSEQIYSRVLDTRPLDWAKVGLAQVKAAKGEFPQAQEILNEVIKNNPQFMQAYDVLSNIYRDEEDMEKMQSILMRAVDACPLGIKRQQTLASVAERNNDIKVATEAYAKSVELGAHSIHDKIECHIGFARNAAGLIAINDPDAESFTKKAHTVLDGVAKRFDCKVDSLPQLKLLQTQMEMNKRQVAQAEGLLHQAEKVLNDQRDTMSVTLAIDWVQTLNVCGHEKRSKSLLNYLVERFRDDEDALEKLDKLLDEPISQTNLKRVASVNRKGIGLYEDKRFKEAIEVFKKAQQMFPRYIAVHLNLAQTINGDVRENGYDPVLMTLCLNTLSRVESLISEEHEQYDRFKQLYSRARELNSLQ